MTRLSAAALVKVLACSLICCATARAQIPATRLEGTVRAASAGPISGAVVTATQERTGWRAQTLSDAQGRFVFPSLAPGRYTVLADAEGFRPTAHTDVILGVSAVITEEFALLPGGATESESEEAPPLRLIASESEISASFTRREFDVLPLLDRNPLALSIYQPGVQIRASDPPSSTVNGTTRASNQLTLDAIEVRDPVDPRLGESLVAVNPESIEQFRSILSGGSAQYGRNAGAYLMMVTRAGASRWAGSAFEYFRNEWLNANDFFNNSSGTPRPKFRQHIFGGSLGGPMIRNRTLIFGSYQGRRTAREVVRNRTVLTPEAKSGLFQWYPPGTSTASSFDILQNDPRQLGIDPAVAAVLAQLPDPNNFDIGDGLNSGGFRFNNPQDADEDQLTLRVDHSLTGSHGLFFRFSGGQAQSDDLANDADARYPGQPQGTVRERSWALSAGSDWGISARTVNQLRAGYRRAKLSLERPARTAAPMFLANSWTDPLDPSFSRWRNSPVIEVTDNLTMIRGRHAIKAGGTFRYISQRSHNEDGIYPDVTFGLGDGNRPPISIGPSGTRITQSDRLAFENLYNDLLGRMEQVTQTFYSNLETYLPAGAARERDLAFREYGVFLQDDWKLTPGLTLNLGVRYEFGDIPSESDGIIGALDKADAISANANIADFTVVRGGAWYRKDLKNFAPRAGFAWAPWNSTRMVLRGGFGIYYDRLSGATADFVDNNTPASVHVTTLFPNLGGSDLRLRDGIPSPSPPAAPSLTLPDTRSASVALFRSDLRTPYVRQFHLSLQREVFANTIVEAGYVGQRGKKLFMNLNLNQLKIEGDFLQAFQELQRFRANGTPVPPSNTLVKIFGSVNSAISAIGGTTLDLGLAGDGADTVDRIHFGKYAAAGVSNFYLRNFPQYDELIWGSNDGRSSYDSLQINVRRNSGPLRVSGNYTWSKSLDNLSSVCEGCAVPLDSFDPQRYRTASDTDRKHSLNAWVVYSLPFGSGRQFASDASGFVGALVSGWDLGALGVWQSGSRFSTTSGRMTARANVYSLADYAGDTRIGSISRRSDAVYWFTPEQIAQFEFPAAGGLGSSGVNSFLGPGYFNLDVSLIRNVPLGEAQRLSFRLEAYNVLNRTNFAVPNSNLSEPASFGRISAIQGYPRQLQVAVRFDF